MNEPVDQSDKMCLASGVAKLHSNCLQKDIIKKKIMGYHFYTTHQDPRIKFILQVILFKGYSFCLHLCDGQQYVKGYDVELFMDRLSSFHKRCVGVNR